MSSIIIGRTTYSKSQENLFRKSINFLMEWFLIKFLNDFERSDPCYLGRPTTSKSQENLFRKSINFYLIDFILDFWMILNEATHLVNLESYPLRPGKLCSWSRGAMLLRCKSNALDLKEHAFIYLRSNVLIPTEQCSGRYQAVLLRVKCNEFLASSFLFLDSCSFSAMLGKRPKGPSV